ncbi:hypothetical protein [Spirosoma rhododendri]|uniref:hypothetical protein n=1 Tax=Spirosoma rhododendri TaxID=2728024 RepID=UPI0020C58DE7|nr:hypothetical protein [Spirosoma rhododendri]
MSKGVVLLTLASSVLGGATLLPGAEGAAAAGAAAWATAPCRRVAAVPRRPLAAAGADAVTTAADCSDVAGGVTTGVATGLGVGAGVVVATVTAGVVAGVGTAAVFATVTAGVGAGVATVGSGVELPDEAGCVLIGGVGDVDAVWVAGAGGLQTVLLRP